MRNYIMSKRKKEPTYKLPFKLCLSEPLVIRTNDPEITNHVLWPTELKRQVGLLHRAATTKYPCCGQALGIPREHAV